MNRPHGTAVDGSWFGNPHVGTYIKYLNIVCIIYTHIVNIYIYVINIIIYNYTHCICITFPRPWLTSQVVLPPNFMFCINVLKQRYLHVLVDPRLIKDRKHVTSLGKAIVVRQ